MSVVIPAAPQAARKRRRLTFFGGSASSLPLISADEASPFAESFRLLALNVRTMLAFEARRSVAIMSGYAKDGRSVVAANLAIALASEHRVLLVDERRRAFAGPGSLTELFRQAPGSAAQAIPGDMMRSVVDSRHPGVSIMPRLVDAGSPDDDLDAAITKASEAGMYTVIDTPPALTTTAAFEEAKLAGNVLYVVRGATTDLDAHRRVREQLERLNVNVLGILLNEH